MKIAIAGAGIAGGYLAHLLDHKGLSMDVFDAMDHDTRCRCRSCGWGVSAGTEKHLAAIGLDLNEYLLEPMPSMNFDGLVAGTPLITVDKPRLIRDLTKNITLKRQNLGQAGARDYDTLVDATGIKRAFLPPCRSDLTLPTLQQRVAVESNGDRRLEAGVYGNQVPGLGYVWVFPLGRNQYHIGIGGIGHFRPESVMDQFYGESPVISFTVCICGEIRSHPRLSTPLYQGPRHNNSQLIWSRRIDRHCSTVHW
jgi:flavin-dependent dehydrogenase